jgi:demethylmenaquinone methyltransferase / 2-methoxy-6-polyprenyl-1,4-benzoquinol methylase
MSNLTGKEHTQYVRQMFGRIASRYDLMNRIMTAGQDIRLRKEAVRKLKITQGSLVLDVGCGTGDLAFEIVRKYPNARVIASDLTPEMISVGKARSLGKQVNWVIADAQHLPFPNASIDCIISGYLLRNVTSVHQTLEEQFRVLLSGGRIASLDTTPQRDKILQSLVGFYLHRIIPIIGRIFTGDVDAYTYLPESTAQFLSAEKLAEQYIKTGFTVVKFVRRMFGVMAIHWGAKGRS